MDIKNLINSYLEQSMLLQIATTVNNIPWICTVCFAYDDRFNLYWLSKHDARHSQEIKKNPIVAGAIAVPYTFGKPSEGLQIYGTALEIHDEENITKGLAVIGQRYKVIDARTKQMKEELLSGSQDYGLYRLYPEEIILHDKKDFPQSPRHVYKIPHDDLDKDIK